MQYEILNIVIIKVWLKLIKYCLETIDWDENFNEAIFLIFCFDYTLLLSDIYLIHNQW